MLKRFVAVTLSTVLLTVAATPVSATAFSRHALERLIDASTFKDRFIEPQLLASAATRLASADLAVRMCKAPYLQANKKTITTVIFSNGLDKTAVGHYRALVMQLSELKTIGVNLIDAAARAQCLQPDTPDGCGESAVPRR
jgi:hypothetical protein